MSGRAGVLSRGDGRGQGSSPVCTMGDGRRATCTRVEAQGGESTPATKLLSINHDETTREGRKVRMNEIPHT